MATLCKVHTHTHTRTHTHTTEKKHKSHYPGYVCFTLSLGSGPKLWYVDLTGALGATALDFITTLASLFWSHEKGTQSLNTEVRQDDGSECCGENLAASQGLRAQLVICSSSEELVRCHPPDCWDLISVKRRAALYCALIIRGVLCSPAE